MSTISQPAAVDTLIAAMETLDAATEHLARWPWSTRRRRAMIVALNTVLELHVAAIAQAVTLIYAEHEVRIQRLERPDGTREVGTS